VGATICAQATTFFTIFLKSGFLTLEGVRVIILGIAHTVGPKVLRSMEEALELPPSALQRSWDSLDRAGNLSSASVLFVLSDLLQAQEVQPGDDGMMLALGPGFCAELALLQW
jgi:alkylresorcinol/alkylpyrone synthase